MESNGCRRKRKFRYSDGENIRLAQWLVDNPFGKDNKSENYNEYCERWFAACDIVGPPISGIRAKYKFLRASYLKAKQWTEGDGQKLKERFGDKHFEACTIMMCPWFFILQNEVERTEDSSNNFVNQESDTDSIIVSDYDDVLPPAEVDETGSPPALETTRDCDDPLTPTAEDEEVGKSSDIFISDDNCCEFGEIPHSEPEVGREIDPSSCASDCRKRRPLDINWTDSLEKKRKNKCEVLVEVERMKLKWEEEKWNCKQREEIAREERERRERRLILDIHCMEKEKDRQHQLTLKMMEMDHNLEAIKLQFGLN